MHKKAYDFAIRKTRKSLNMDSDGWEYKGTEAQVREDTSKEEEEKEDERQHPHPEEKSLAPRLNIKMLSEQAAKQLNQCVCYFLASTGVH